MIDRKNAREDRAMPRKSGVKLAAFGMFAASALATSVHAQEAGARAAAWRGAGEPACIGSDGGAFKCPPAPEKIAIRAGRLFDSRTGQMLAKQVVLIEGERITDVGPEAQIKIPAAAQVIDLSQATV